MTRRPIAILASVALTVCVLSCAYKPRRAVDLRVVATPVSEQYRVAPDGRVGGAEPDNFFQAELMMPAACRAACIIPDKKALGGFAKSDNLPTLITNRLATRAEGVYLLAQPNVTTDSRGQVGMRLVLVNPTNLLVPFNACDGRLSIIQEALDEDNQWRPIEYLLSSWCGNSYHRVFLKPGEFWEFATPRYRGSFATKLRFRFMLNPELDIYSNEFEGSVNPTQFTKKQPYQPKGWWDSYYEVK